MTNRDRDSVAKLLLAVADRLAGAPADTLARAEAYLKRDPMLTIGAQHAHQAGGLEHVCESEAATLRHLIANYLTTAPSKPRRPRTRR